MALAECIFYWDIYDPFLPGRDVEATFYMGYPTVTQWRATVRPMNRGINFLEFSFSLKFDEWWDQSKEIVARKIRVQIFLNGEEIEKKEVYDRCFNPDNHFRYDFRSRVSISPQTKHCFNVVINIGLPNSAVLNEIEYEYCHEDDLRSLSRSLSLLLSNPQYSNMMLIPKDFQEPIRVHSYIIGARWNNFFALHAFVAGIHSSVETNITHAVLQDILTYMYSGTIGITWPDWTDPEYTTELFQVIDRYKLYHLYKVFVKDDMFQYRETRYSGIMRSNLFPLQFTNDRKLIDIPSAWIVESGPEYGLIFSMCTNQIFGRHINQNRDIPLLTYTLLSLSSSRLHVRVNLELVIQMNEDPITSRIFHEEVFTIQPFAAVGSQNELSLGYPETFSQSNFAELKYFTRCYLSVTDGTTVEQIRNVVGFCLNATDDVVDDTKLDESARFGVLSDHMFLLRRRPGHHDMMRVLCPLKAHDEPLRKVDVHKGIFDIRVPAWWQGLENVPPAKILPDYYITPTLSHGSLFIVLDYIYTGKIIPNQGGMNILYLDEIQEFARRTGFFSLLNTANRIKSHFANLYRNAV